ncbi:MAG: DUF2207 domain-containing protein [Clostridiaceae bacterium]|nr:DUF2207 domain-containing protein [Clostridiaceae bacterium]
MLRKISGIAILVFALVFASISMICFPLGAAAEESLVISRWMVDARISEAGDLNITEDITFKFNDKFNGVFRDIGLKGTFGVSDISVQEIMGTTGKEYVHVEDAKKGDSGVFLIKEESDKIRIQIFSPSEDQEKTFRINYKVKNVAVRYNDVGELYYKFLGDENETPIDIFKVIIRLPQEDLNNQVKVFAHGPLNGEIRKESNTTYSLYVEDVPSGTFIEGRILFPREFIPLSQNVKNIDNYSKILEEEAAYQNRQARARERAEANKRILGQFSFLGSVIGVLLVITLSFLFRREKNVYKSEYEESAAIPEDCTPAIAAYLTGNMMNANIPFATILDLFRKGYMEIKEEKDDYVFYKLKEDDSNLLNHEKYFMNWLFNVMGNGRSVSTRDIENYNKRNSYGFIRSYNEWRNKIKEDAVSKGYYDTSKIKYGVFVLVLSIVLFVVSVLTLVYENLFGLSGLAVSIILFIYSIALFYRYSDYGHEQYKRWIKFKKYMKNLKKTLSKQEIINSLDISLIYALGLGVQFKGNIFNPDEFDEINYHNNNWLLWYLLFSSNENNSFRRRLNKSFAGSSSYHSSGGFSGGGGGGSGGGGAGGF